ncbi:hypothetical protein [Paraburkholderia lacunae]|nr:hypothetical protein [Paraburkholderia lacunae]
MDALLDGCKAQRPQKYVPGGKMREAVPDANKRAAIVQYLKSQ